MYAASAVFVQSDSFPSPLVGEGCEKGALNRSVAGEGSHGTYNLNPAARARANQGSIGLSCSMSSVNAQIIASARSGEPSPT